MVGLIVLIVLVLICCWIGRFCCGLVVILKLFMNVVCGWVMVLFLWWMGRVVLMFWCVCGIIFVNKGVILRVMVVSC